MQALLQVTTLYWLTAEAKFAKAEYYILPVLQSFCDIRKAAKICWLTILKKICSPTNSLATRAVYTFISLLVWNNTRNECNVMEYVVALTTTNNKTTTLGHVRSWIRPAAVFSPRLWWWVGAGPGFAPRPHSSAADWTGGPRGPGRPLGLLAWVTCVQTHTFLF